jgi:hypothetical protein
MIRNKAYDFFLHHVMNKELTEKLFHQCPSPIDEVFRPFFFFFYLQRDEEKKIISFIS